MTNEEYIKRYRRENVRTLALRKAEEGVDVKWCLQQIEGWQKACDKLPHWAQIEGLHFPPVLSMEQCSSELTACYKRDIAMRILAEADERKVFVDLTGGYGVDFSYMSSLFATSCYVEKSVTLCHIAEHNFKLLDLPSANVTCADSIDFLKNTAKTFSMIYVDPARRDDVGRKTVAIGDCAPNLQEIQDEILHKSRYVLIKLSPMLDISAALSVLKNVREVHVVSVKGECKELLFLQDNQYEDRPLYYASNLDSSDGVFCCTDEQKASVKSVTYKLEVGGCVEKYLYEPNASILKAGVQDVLCEKYGVTKLHPMSNLFVSSKPVSGFPGRNFEIVGMCGFGKKELKAFVKDVSRANITIRNFPSSVAELRKKLRLADGGDVYLFATTLADGSHVLVRCRKQG